MLASDGRPSPKVCTSVSQASWVASIVSKQSSLRIQLRAVADLAGDLQPAVQLECLARRVGAEARRQDRTGRANVSRLRCTPCCSAVTSTAITMTPRTAQVRTDASTLTRVLVVGGQLGLQVQPAGRPCHIDPHRQPDGRDGTGDEDVERRSRSCRPAARPASEARARPSAARRGHIDQHLARQAQRAARPGEPRAILRRRWARDRRAAGSRAP